MRRLSFMTIGLVLLPFVIASSWLVDDVLADWLIAGGYLVFITAGLVLDLRAMRPVPERVKWLLDHPLYRPVMLAVFAGWTGAFLESGEWLGAGTFGLLAALNVYELARDRRRLARLLDADRRLEDRAKLTVELATRYAISVDEARAMVERGVR